MLLRNVDFPSGTMSPLNLLPSCLLVQKQQGFSLYKQHTLDEVVSRSKIILKEEENKNKLEEEEDEEKKKEKRKEKQRKGRR